MSVTFIMELFTAQMMIKDLKHNHPKVLERFLIKASDRKCQI